MQQTSLKYPYYVIQTKSFISSDDLRNLRTFYGPIISADAVYLYEWFVDFAKGQNQKSSSVDFNSTGLFLGMDRNRLEQARLKLEGIGLINTYLDDSKLKTVFDIQKPLDAKGIKANEIISELIIRKIGKSNFDAFIKERVQTISIIKGNNFTDITANFVDVFMGEEEHKEAEEIAQSYVNNGRLSIENNQIQTLFNTSEYLSNKLTIGYVKYSNHYEALIKLSTVDFLQQIKERAINDTEEQLLASFEAKIENSKIINLVTYLACNKYKRATTAWMNLANKLIDELLDNNITDFETVLNYFNGKFMSMTDSSFKAILDSIIICRNTLN
ncbi:hypothetical protein ACJA23_01550 [Mycoplasma corogypsi]|uniref:hypothetical protein n=1 Tax=Mycoplasma corogypsi TaxID=2106 RepID=UPI003873C844